MPKYLILFALIVLMIKANAQSDAFYYYKEGRIGLKETNDKLLIRLKDGNDEPAKERFRARMAQDMNFHLVSPGYDRFEGEYFLLNANPGKSISKEEAINFYVDEPYIASVSFAYEDEEGGLTGITQELCVKGTDMETIRSMAESYGMESITKDRYADDVYHLFFPKRNKMSTLDICNRLSESGQFGFATPNFYMRARAQCATDDPYFPHQWALYNDGSHSFGGPSGVDINVCNAWAYTKGTDQYVAVIDVGVDRVHPDLIDKVPPIGGADFFANTSGGSPSSNDAHGTAVAGIIAAASSHDSYHNGLGVSGIAPVCGIFPVRVAIGDGCSSGWITDASKISNGIDSAWRNGNVWAINNSWTAHTPNALIDNAIHNAVTIGRDGYGCIVTFCTGNDNNSSIQWPSSNPEVIAVGGMSQCNQRKSPSSCDGEPWGSNYGVGLSVVAPAVNIASTDLSGAPGYSTCSPNIYMHDFPGDNNYVQTFDGTSAPAAMVSAVAMLVLSVNNCLRWDEVRDIIALSADKVGGYSYNPATVGTWNAEMGHGRLNAGDAVKLAYDMYRQNQTEVSVKEYQAAHKLFAGHTVTFIIPTGYYTISPGSHIHFKAPESINLQPGFMAKAGSVFLAEIRNDCKMNDRHYKNGNNDVTEAQQAVKKLDELSKGISIYPNPNTGTFSIELLHAGDYDIKVLNTVGSVVHQYKLQGQKYQLHLDDKAPAGNYMIQVSGKDSRFIEKITVIK